MAKGQRISPLIVQEAMASGDGQFLDLLRQVEPKALPALLDRWKRDFRPWAREQILKFLDGPLVVSNDRLIVKRLFKHAEESRDHELVGAFMASFDRYVRRRLRTRKHYDWSARQVWTEQVLYSPGDTIRTDLYVSQNSRTGERIAVPPSPRRREGNPFSYRTRSHLRRRAWRYFRRLGYQKPGEYSAAVAGALARYRDADLADGLAVLDCWGLVHACFGESDALKFTPAHASMTRPARLEEMVAPYFPELWKSPATAAVLLNLLWSARARVVMMWAAHLLRRDHASALTNIPFATLLKLLDHPDAQIQQLGAELFENAAGLDRVDIPTWLRLLETKNVTAVALIAGAMRTHVGADRLTLDQTIDLARAKPVPVARLGLEFLRQRTYRSAADRQEIARLASAKCEAAGAEIAGFALSVVGSADAYDVDLVSRFFDSLLATIRAGAWAWLTEASPGWSDPPLWVRLLESPYDDVRVRLIDQLTRRSKLPGVGVAGLATLWCGALLAVHRGGRAKLRALRQISDALKDGPEHAELLIPVLAVAIRSVRLPEARAGLAAIVGAADARPDLAPLIRQHLPELTLEPEGVTA